MKHTKRLMLLVLLASLLLGLAACGGDTEAEPTSPPAENATEVSQAEPTDAPTLEPTEAPEPTSPPTDTPLPEPTDTPEVEEEFDLSSLSSTADLSSYKSTMQVTMTLDNNGQEEEQTIEIFIEYTSEPKAQHFIMSGAVAGPEVEDSVVEMYLVEDTMYMKMEDQWLSLPATEEDLDPDAFITPDAMLEDICGWHKEGREEIDGVKVVHWSFTKDDIDKCMPAEELVGLGELTNATGDLYVAEDESYVVLMELLYEGEDLDMDIGDEEETAKVVRMEIHYETTDVNEPFVIEVPAEATESSALPDDIPVPEGSEGVSSMFGMITFTSETPAEEVYAFYQEEMPNNGWTEVSAEAMTGLWMLEYTKDNRTASFMISEDDSGNASVMITVMEE